MPILANPRHERFCQEYAQGKSADEAYTSAGYKKHRQAASRLLLSNVDVASRVSELQAEAAKAVGLTKQWVTQSLIELANQSRNKTSSVYNGPVAVRSLELLGKELGMFVDRSETRNLNVNYALHPAPPSTEEEWLAKHAPKQLDS
jgi:hypothetical protein